MFVLFLFLIKKKYSYSLGQKLKTKISAGLISSGDAERELFHAPLLASGGCGQFLVFVGLHIYPIYVSIVSWHSLCVSLYPFPS